MGRLIAAFDDRRALATGLSRLAESLEGVEVRVIETLAERDEQPLPPELGGGSQVPVATPTAATGRDVSPGGPPHPEGMQGPSQEDLIAATGGDDEAASRYARVIADGGAVVIVEGSNDELDRAEELMRASRPTTSARYS